MPVVLVVRNIEQLNAQFFTEAKAYHPTYIDVLGRSLRILGERERDFSERVAHRAVLEDHRQLGQVSETM